MPIAEIKNRAASLPPLDNAALTAEVQRLKQHGAALLACIAFVQANRRISLNEAKRLTLSLPVFGNEEKPFLNRPAKSCRQSLSKKHSDDIFQVASTPIS